jgi:hypothetical protein
LIVLSGKGGTLLVKRLRESITSFQELEEIGIIHQPRVSDVFEKFKEKLLVLPPEQIPVPWVS